MSADSFGLPNTLLNKVSIEYKEPFFKDLTDTNLRKVLYEDQFKQIEENLTPFGIVNDGLPERAQPEVIDSDLWWNQDPEAEMKKMKRNWLENV